MREKSLNWYDKAILTYIALRQGDNGECYPKGEDIAIDLGIDPKTVTRSTDRLDRLGRIRKVRVHGGRKQNNTYSLVGQLVPPDQESRGTESPAKQKSRGTESPADGGTESPARPQSRGTESPALYISNKYKQHNKSNREFTPPTPNQVSDYAKSIDFKLQGEKFCDYYLAQGWKLANGQPMKDWRAAVRNWQRTEKKNGNYDGRTTTGDHGKTKSGKQPKGNADDSGHSEYDRPGTVINCD